MAARPVLAVCPISSSVRNVPYVGQRERDHLHPDQKSEMESLADSDRIRIVLDRIAVVAKFGQYLYGVLSDGRGKVT